MSGPTISHLLRFSILAVLLAGAMPGWTIGAGSTCDRDALDAAKQEFLNLRDLHRAAPEYVTAAELRFASEQYIAASEQCYRSLHGTNRMDGIIIDEGGLWAGGITPRHNLNGRKWGAGSPFAGGANVAGPRLPGGQRSYSYMANGVSIGNDAGTGASCAPGCINTSIFSFGFTDSGGDTEQARCLQREIGDAFAAWSAVADITFVPTADNGAPFDAAGATGDIRIGFHPIDGAFGVLAHAFFPPPNGTSQAGDIHFDVAEPWACSNEIGSLDFGIVALHEIGHSIGLNHEVSGQTAVMNASYNSALNFGPAADDIIGAANIYGGSPLGGHTFFGNVGIGTDTPASALQVRRDDGTAQVRVTEASGTTAQRTLFALQNNGGPIFDITDTNSSTTWSFLLNSVGGFGFNLLGTGGFEFTITSAGRVLIGPGSNTVFDLSPTGNLNISGNLTANGIFYPSDRALKENIVELDGGDMLDRLMDLPVYRWNYRSDPRDIPRIGPMAQDFYSLFGVGKDERHLNPLDVAGVSLTAVQGLRKQVSEQEEELARQRDEIESLKAQLAELSRALQTGGGRK